MHDFRDPNALQLRIAIRGVDPAVWRRLVVPLSWHLGQLHFGIQAAFNWWNCHLHEFRIGGLRYGDPETEDRDYVGGPRVFDERGARLLDFDAQPGLRLLYVYDFGDNWQHEIEFETLLALDEPPRRATCIAGERARPPEDVGGTPGYEHFLAIIADPDDPEHADTVRWCGGHFDPEWFDLTVVNKDLGNALRPSVRRRLFQPKPKRTA